MIGRRSFLGGAGALIAAGITACAKGRGSTKGRGPTGPADTALPGPPGATDGPNPPTSDGSATAPGTPTAPTGMATFLASGPAAGAGVALTFHGAGNPTLARALLNEAAAVRCPITVFAVGQWLAQNPTMAQRILAGGHELANHTWSHIDILHLPEDGIAAEIVRCRDVIASQTKVAADYFRPSQTPDGLSVPDVILRQAGTAGYATVVGYDVDPSDYRDPGSALVHSRVRDKLHAGAIVSLHFDHQGTVNAFRPIVASIRAKGLTPVLLRDLLAHG